MDYWAECIEVSFEENGITASEEQIQLVAGDVESAHENHGMAHGHDAIPNPRNADVDRLTGRLKELEQERDQMELYFKKNVAERRRCDVNDVSINEDGRAIVYR